MIKYLKILNKDNESSELNFVKDGEFKIYDDNIRQKKTNNLEIKLSLSQIEINYSNFGYSNDGNIICLISSETFLILYDLIKFEITGIFKLFEDFDNDKENFIASEKRNFIKKIMTRLTFFQLNQKTNNININNEGNSIIICSVDRKNLYFLNTNKKNKLYNWTKLTIQEIMNEIDDNNGVLASQVICDELDFVNGVNKLIYNHIDMSQYDFSRNFYLNVQIQTNYSIIIMIFYYSDKNSLNNYLIIYKLIIRGNNESLKICESNVDYIVLNKLKNEERNGVQFIKAKTNHLGTIICVGLTYENDYLELVIYNSELKIFKKFSSNDFSFSNSKEIFKINDLFINENMLICIINSTILIIVDINYFQILLNSINNSSSQILSLNHIFLNESNKTLYVKTFTSGNIINFYLFTKKTIKVFQASLETTFMKLSNLYTRRSEILNLVQNYQSKADITVTNFGTDYNFYFFFLFIIKELTSNMSYEQLLKLYKSNKDVLILAGLRTDAINIMKKPCFNLQSKIMTLKFKEFFNLNFSEIISLQVKRFNLKSEKECRVRKYCNEMNSYKNLDEFKYKECKYDKFRPNDYKFYELKIYNLIFIEYIVSLVFKNLIHYQINKNDLSEYLKASVVVNFFTKTKEEKSEICECLKRFAFCIFKPWMINSDYTNELTQMKRNYLKRLLKIIKSNNVSGIFTLVKQYYVKKEFLNIISFSFYLVLYYYFNNKSSKIYSSFFILDIIISLDNEISYDQIINLYFRKKINFCFIYKDEFTNDCLILNVLLILDQSDKLFYKFENLSRENQLKFIFMISKLNSVYNTINSNKLVSSLSDINSNKHVGNLSKKLVSFVFIYINKNKSKLDIETLVILFHIKINGVYYKKLLIEKILFHLENDFRIKLSNFIRRLKTFTIEDYFNNFYKDLFKNSFEINDDLFYRILINDKYEQTDFKSEFYKLFDDIKEMSKTIVSFLNFLLEKNKNKKYFFEILLGKTVDFPGLKKYQILISSIKQIMIYLFIFKIIFELIVVINNLNILKAEDATVKCSRCDLILSFLYTLLFPNEDPIFMGEVIESFYYNINLENFNIDYLQVFFTYVDFSYRKNDNQIKLKEIKRIINFKFPIIYEKLMNLNIKKTNFIRKSDFSKLYEYFLSDENNFFLNFCEVSLEYFQKKLLEKNILRKIKSERSKLKKNSNQTFYNLEYLINYKQFFKNEKNNILYDNCNKTCNTINSEELDKKSILNLNDYRKFDNKTNLQKNEMENTENIIPNDIVKDLKKNEEKINDNTDYSIDDVSNISDLSFLSENIVNKSENKEEKIKLPIANPNEFDGILLGAEDNFKDKLINTINQKQIEKNDVLFDKEIPFKKSMREPNTKKVEIDEISFKNKKKKYISIKIIRKVLMDKINFHFRYFLRTLKIINVNLTNEIEITHNIVIKNSKIAKETKIKKNKTKLIGKSLYPKLDCNKFK